MADKNFIMKQKTSDGYDTLYPQTVDEQVKLSDNVQDLFRIENGTVNNVLAQLGFYNQYFWKRRSVVEGYYEKKTKTNRGTPLTSGERLFAFVVENNQETVQYSSNITINQSTGSVSLSNPQIITLPNASASSLQTAQILKGKYFMGGTDAQSSQIYYIEDFAQIQQRTIEYPQSGIFNEICVEVDREPYNVYEITSQYIATYGDWEIVYSTDSTTYPHSGVSDGYIYEYLDCPFNNAIDVPKIETVSYVGTGTNNVSVSFSSVPQFVFITKGFTELSTLSVYDYLIPNADIESINKIRTYSINVQSSSEQYIDYKWTSDRKTLTWSGYSGQIADNYSGIHYRAIAVC